jgi:3-phenylpropionate/cinnamic acid dioxygenase small subunit
MLEQKVTKVRAINTLRAACEGTVAHELLEQCINERCDPAIFLGEARTVYDETEMVFPMTFYVNDEMVEGVRMFQQHIKDYSGLSHTEMRLQHSKIPELQGTADYVCVDGDHLFLDDLKYGKGTVQAINRKGEVNTQLLCYASMVFDRFEGIETATLSIVQPRAKTKKKIRSTDITRADINAFIERVEAVGVVLEQISSGEAQTMDYLKTGSHCYFCPAKSICDLHKRDDAERMFGKL